MDHSFIPSSCYLFKCCSGWFWWDILIVSQNHMSHCLDYTPGIATDMLVYSTVIPVFPFQLERLGYSCVSSLVAWLLFAYVHIPWVCLCSPVILNNMHSQAVWYCVHVLLILMDAYPDIKSSHDPNSNAFRTI